MGFTIVYNENEIIKEVQEYTKNLFDKNTLSQVIKDSDGYLVCDQLDIVNINKFVKIMNYIKADRTTLILSSGMVNAYLFNMLMEKYALNNHIHFIVDKETGDIYRRLFNAKIYYDRYCTTIVG